MCGSPKMPLHYEAWIETDDGDEYTGMSVLGLPTMVSTRATDNCLS